MFYKNNLKRIFDIILSFFAIILLSPLMLIVAILVKMKLGSPVIFAQQRIGLNGKPFTLYKFRSMSNEVDENGELLPNEQRMTRFGRVFRSTSLDELPELFNILKGDMSFIGPRPLLKEYLPYYNEEQMKRHYVRPGLTSYTAVNGRNSLSWEKRLEMDVWYVNNVSIGLDLRILIKTIFVVLKRENISGNRGRFVGTDKCTNQPNNNK